jgi:hypothetical protein
MRDRLLELGPICPLARLRLDVRADHAAASRSDVFLNSRSLGLESQP